MSKFSKNKIIRGTFGKLWMDEERLSGVKSFEAKVSLEFEEMYINGVLGKQKRYMGYSGTGTMTLYKFDSTVLRKYQAGILNGDLPDMKLMSALDDPASYGAERVKFNDVTLDDVPLIKFENKGLLEETYAFSFGSFEFLDLIS